MKSQCILWLSPPLPPVLGETIDILVLACILYLFLPECADMRLVLVS
jgi:hypothetical protein